MFTFYFSGAISQSFAFHSHLLFGLILYQLLQISFALRYSCVTPQETQSRSVPFASRLVIKVVPELPMEQKNYICVHWLCVNYK